jgi:diguanylate cyclase (GGDEF)-like protein/PAS domain S-box-containing protein
MWYNQRQNTEKVKTQMNKQSIKNAFSISLLYLLFGFLWIYFSDSAVEAIAAETSQLALLQTYKGLFYIFLTALVLFLVSHRFFHRQYLEYKEHLAQQQLLKNSLETKDILLRQTSTLAKVGGWNFDPISLKGEWTDEIVHIHDLDSAEGMDVNRGIEFYAPESRPIIEKAVKAAVEEGKPYDLELEIITAKGVRKWVRTAGSPIIKNRKVVQVHGLLQDITEQKNTQLALERQHTLLQTIVESSPDAIFVKDLEGRYLIFNAAASAFVGLPYGYAIGKKDDHIFSAETAQKLRKKDSTILDKGVVLTYEETLVTAKDEVKVFLTTKGPICRADGTPFGSFGISRDMTERTQYEQRILQAKERFDRLAHYDPLTDLPNRLSLIETIRTKTSNEATQPFCLFFLDLDEFQQINDSYGHSFGDKLLIKVARLLEEALPSDTFIVRTGGDEFVAVIDCEKEKTLLTFDLDRVVERLSHPFDVDGVEVYITASIGAAMYPNDAKNGEDLFKYADAAMYQAKKEGKNIYRFYTPVYTQRAIDRTSISNNLKKALDNAELELYYQPQVDPYSGKIIGYEALMRWETPQGFIPPSVFIPICEESGLILKIGEFALLRGCETALKWKKSGNLQGQIAINVSVRQLIHPDFLSVLDNAIATTQCDPSFIELEITESSIMENPQKVITLLNVIKSKGFMISIDDFGTGYSSLSYLKHLPVDKLKIDISFVRNIQSESKNQTIVKTIIALAKGLGMKVLAEGVETKPELEFLCDNRIDTIQGFYYYKPMPAEQIEALSL